MPDLPNATRQWLNLVLGLGVPLMTAIAFALGLNFTDATSGERGEALIVPASYAFSIWGPIYLGIVVYAIYQFLPGQRENPLLQDAGLWTASAFFFTSAWLLLATYDRLWQTVACIVAMLLSLAMVQGALLNHRETLTWADRIIVWLPMSLFAGWVTLATFANLASALKVSEWIDLWLPEAQVTIVMLVVAAAVGVAGTLWMRGNPAYALTLVWGLYAIVVESRLRGERGIIAAAWLALGAVAAASIAGLVRNVIRR